MIRVGIVGLGFMGRMHYRCWSALAGVEVAAVCEASEQVLQAAGQPVAGNVGGAAERIDLDRLQIFRDLESLVSSGSVDAVSITLPTFLHRDASLTALGGGLHVLCEKPMALSVEDCDAMVDAARRAGKVLQIGHCIRFWPEYVVARELVVSGQYGAPIAASFRRYSAMPSWSPDSWFADESRSGGQPMDLHIHDSDYVHYLFGLPESVSSTADTSQGYISSQYRYPGGPAVVAEGCWRMAPGFSFEMSFNIVLERATVVYDCTRTPSFRVLTADGESFTPQVPPGDGYTREIEHFARAVAGQEVEPVVTPEQSRDTIRLVLAEKRSAREGRVVLL